MPDRTARIRCPIPLVAGAIERTLVDHGWTVVADDDRNCDVEVVFVRTRQDLAEVRDTAGRSSGSPVVALIDEVDADLVAEIVGAGATSVLSWETDPTRLAYCVDLAACGISTLPLTGLAWIVSHGTDAAALTDAERSWLAHLAEGITITQLAPLAGYSERSLYRQLNALYARLGVNDRLSAIAEARRRGLL